jgi:S-adenosylhomocysteine hydrolase
LLQILDDGGDATHLMLKRYPAMFNMIKGQVEIIGYRPLLLVPNKS